MYIINTKLVTSEDENFPTVDRIRLLDDSQEHLRKDPAFLHAFQPILLLIANGYAKKGFYQTIAKKLELEYTDSLPVKINDSKSLSNRVGTKIQSQYLFFAYQEEDSLIIATPDPTPLRKMVENTLPFMAEKPRSIIVKICPISTVREALSQSAYILSNQLAESRLKNSNPLLSSYHILTKRNSRIALLTFLGFLVLLFFYPQPVFLGIYVFINVFYFLLNPFKGIVTITGIFAPPSDTLHTDRLYLPEENLPIYTILIPLKNEEAVVPKLIRHLRLLDYPAEKLDIKIILEVNDSKTLAAVEKELRLISEYDPDNLVFHIVKVPLGEISTKPRSLNFALQFSRGSVSVIYDAEDRPDPLQLKKAFSAFLANKLDTLCIQAKLNYYNPTQNFLTMFFTMEYSFWFDALLPGLQYWRIPIPLGGTSNHFLTDTLEKIGMWDPYNVTEDADLGWRLARLGYTTSMVDSYTFEEANSKLWNWIKQRTRWQKGFLMTLLVHMRTPKNMWQELGAWGCVTSILLFTTNFFLPVINPLLWIVFLLWYIPEMLGLHATIPIPHWLEVIGFINLVLGNGIYMLIHALGAIKTKRYHLLFMTPFIPLYWFLISFASYRAIWQIFSAPYAWEKTAHGLDK
ncbi:MAG: glycosyltransferase [Candidatus Moraniibacteriota bacterium]|nr:MAG: glycosyltransferase [Candidatus Moranbacteria bacterium]